MLSNLKGAFLTGVAGRIGGQTDVLEAILSIGLLAAAADGKLGREEVQRVLDNANANPVVNRMFPPDVVSNSKTVLVDRLRVGGREALFKELRDCGAKPDEIRIAIFTAGVSTASIGGIDDAERAVLMKAATALNILDEDRDEIIKAVVDDKIEFDLD